jgi:hypothetical protein
MAVFMDVHKPMRSPRLQAVRSAGWQPPVPANSDDRFSAIVADGSTHCVLTVATRTGLTVWPVAAPGASAGRCDWCGLP